MKAKEFFSRMSDSELVAWWQQYGCAHQAGFYRGGPRKAALAEMHRRGLDTVAPSREVASWGLYWKKNAPVAAVREQMKAQVRE